MNDKELDKLLKESLQKEFSVPEELNRKTYREIKRINDRKTYRFTNLLIIINTILTGMGFVICWQLQTTILYKSILLVTCSSFFTLFLLLYIINYQTHVKKEIVI